MTNGFDGKGGVNLTMTDCAGKEMPMYFPERSWWGETLRKVQDYRIPQRRLTPEEYEKHWGPRK